MWPEVHGKKVELAAERRHQAAEHFLTHAHPDSLMLAFLASFTEINLMGCASGV
jgi:hypothetical protein